MKYAGFILLAVLAIIPVGGKSLADVINISGILGLPDGVSKILSLVVFALVILSLLRFSIWKKRNNK